MAKVEHKLRDQDIAGLKYFRKLEPLLARLHEVGTQRDVAGNRELHMDQYCTLILIWLFSPSLLKLLLPSLVVGMFSLLQDSVGGDMSAVLDDPRFFPFLLAHRVG